MNSYFFYSNKNIYLLIAALYPFYNMYIQETAKPIWNIFRKSISRSCHDSVLYILTWVCYKMRERSYTVLYVLVLYLQVHKVKYQTY